MALGRGVGRRPSNVSSFVNSLLVLKTWLFGAYRHFCICLGVLYPWAWKLPEKNLNPTSAEREVTFLAPVRISLTEERSEDFLVILTCRLWSLLTDSEKYLSWLCVEFCVWGAVSWVLDIHFCCSPIILVRLYTSSFGLKM